MFTVVRETLLQNGNVVPNTMRTILSRHTGATSFTAGDFTISAGGQQHIIARRTTSEVRLVSVLNANHESHLGDNNFTISSRMGFGGNLTTVSQVFTTAPDSKSVTFNTTALSREQLDAGFTYRYEVISLPNTLGMNVPRGIEARNELYRPANFTPITSPLGWTGTIRHLSGSPSSIWVTDIDVIATFGTVNELNENEGGYFLIAPRKYNAYDLIRRALLSIDTRVINRATQGIDQIEYPIIIEDYWLNRLKGTQLFETIFEQKNLWEILLQVGQYLHAIPKIQFAKDGTDRLELTFRQLGKTEEWGGSEPQKITVFNSNNLSEFISQLDAYVSNFYSPQNVVDEVLVIKTSDQTKLISNNTAELHTAYPILELEQFDIMVQVNNQWQTRSAIDHVFEESIYNIVSNESPVANAQTRIGITPTKGNSLFFTLGENKILGLNFVAPQLNPGTLQMALTNVVRAVWGRDFGNLPSPLLFNNLRFRVRYRTQGDVRVNQFRPELASFMKNAALEQYPRHEQFFGQQDKMVDSERFTRNLHGRLIRAANNIYQTQEYPYYNNSKEVGDLVNIRNSPYYVTQIDNELYPDAVLQKVTYSKNFNQLSQIVTIPSEPRFFEVSERSKVKRDIRLVDFFTVSGNVPAATTPRFLHNAQWRQRLRELLFLHNRELPNYAYTQFIVDAFRPLPQQIRDRGQMFPSSMIDRTDANNIQPLSARDNSECIVPLLSWPLKNGIVFKWAMEDNFKAADFTDTTIGGTATTGNTTPASTTRLVDAAYFSQQSFRYVDVMGRADLFRFELFRRTNFNQVEAAALPRAGTGDGTAPDTPIPRGTPYAQVNGGANMFVALDKDNREAISFNYQIQLLHSTEFITFANLFGQKDSELKMMLLPNEQGIFDERVNFANALVDDLSVPPMLIDNGNGALEVRIPQNTGVDLSLVKSICIYQEAEGIGRHAYIVRNVGALPNNQKLQSWWLSPTFL